MATAARDAVGRRARTVYTITEQGRESLAAWLKTPGPGPASNTSSSSNLLRRPRQQGRRAGHPGGVPGLGNRAARRLHLGRPRLPSGPGAFPGALGGHLGQRPVHGGLLRDDRPVGPVGGRRGGAVARRRQPGQTPPWR